MSTPPLPPLFQTPELFELILLNLDTKTLLLAQRTSTHWRTFIATSKPLQRKLFFLPTTTFTDLHTLHLLHPADSAKFNILDATSNRCKWLQQVVVLNDLLFDTSREWRLRSVGYAQPSQIQTPSRVVPSWKNMLLTQPPPSTGKGDVMFWFEDRHDNDELCQDVDTMGAMMERVYAKGCEVDWGSAGVRPVKHPVDGGYYGRLLARRREEEREAEAEEELEVVVWEGEGKGMGGNGEVGLREREREGPVVSSSSSSSELGESDGV
ncbi:hypothetical protein M409DRAFT_21930 [Zasmidium cellare ATCC 36951]|uniref:F-box domain-containing protein n=1 Tax=Zasmidium cellare ATCC 36951 TaxID=1080233 RepID=A0A6A6CNR7_ZASCE|nr:uncharacterized protein M409DRAFT_21930 [Zasmidium cellare ATCC 36951]KAF2167780.1 hypothetical protein M409DRAFT_21930 [Zasmidium cellare ATCC 36951]